MRVIACMGVMLIHITATGVTDYLRGSFPNILFIILNRSLQYVTPLFIFLSGVTSFYSLGDKKFNYIQFLKRRLTKIFIPYFIWCVIYYLSYIYVGYYSFDIVAFIKGVLLGTMSYHFYFVTIIIQLYILAPLFYYPLKKVKWKIPLLIAATVLTAFFIQYFTYKYANRMFLRYILFYMLGIYASLEYEKYSLWLRKHCNLLAAGYLILCSAYIITFYYNFKYYSLIWFIFCIISILFVNVIGLILSEKCDKTYGFIKLFGQSSYYIYLIHPLILMFLIKFTADIGITSVTARLIIYTVIVIPATIIMSFSYTYIKNKFKTQAHVN